MNQMDTTSVEVKFPVPWGHIAAKIYGPPKEKKVLMVHGILDNAGSFDRLIKFLPQNYQYANIDLPGHGLSSAFPPGTPLHFFDYVYSILLVLNALKWKTCIYIGHSFGAQIGTYFSMIYPGRCEKLIALDGFLPFLIEDVIPFIQKLYNLDNYAKDSGTLYTKDEVMHALKFKRRETLKTDAAEALFTRAVTKVNNLYKYNRDVRLRYVARPIFTLEQHKEIFNKYFTETLIIIADSSSQVNFVLDKVKTLFHKRNISVVIVRGNHDVHNNYPERVAPYICQFLDSSLQSKL